MIGHVVDGGRIRELRRALCLTQAELGAKVGVAQNAISRIESGRIGRPQCLAELAAFFGLRVWDLLILPGPANGAGPADQTGAGAGGGTEPGPEGGTEAGRAGTPSAQDPPFWTVPEAAAVLGVSRKIVYRLVRAGALEMEKAGRSWRIPSASVRAYLAPPVRPACDPVPACQQRPELVPIDGRRLRALRQARGWTQLELARRAGLSLSSVSALETGHYTKTSVIAELAQALGVTPGQLQQPPLVSQDSGPAGCRGEAAGCPGEAAGDRGEAAGCPGEAAGDRGEAAPPPWQAHGARLRQLRTARGLTQAEVARRAGLSRSFLSTLERGHRLRPAHIPALARALGVPPSELTATGAELAAPGGR